MNRRQALKVAIASSAGIAVSRVILPEEWITPDVDSVILPAHAQTSPGYVIGSGPCGSLSGVSPSALMCTTEDGKQMERCVSLGNVPFRIAVFGDTVGPCK